MDAPRPERNRIHIHVSVPPDGVEARIAAVSADAEGKETGVAPSMGHE